MANLPLRIPPGMARPGTVYDARGRWYEGNLVRWYEGVLQAIGGWSRLRVAVPSDAELQLGGPVRGMLAWRDNGRTPVLAAGTPTALYAFRGGALYDISPADLAAGIADATAQTGQYGAGPYGFGAYGEGATGDEQLREATTWALDNYGQELVACSVDDGRILRWSDPTSATPAAALANAPTGCSGVVVTPERFVVALGAGGDRRCIAWSDQENPTVWAADALNQAGSFVLTTPGSLLAARRGTQETLLWTDADLWRMSFIGGTFVYSVRQVAPNCGAASRHAMSLSGGRAFWMGQKGFFVYDGYVKPLDCEVADFVFSSINEKQRSKISCYSRSQYGEVVWHYPSGASSECDRYVAYNYRGGFWILGALQRTSGEDATVFGYPIAADASGRIYRHEIANGDYLDVDQTTQLTPYVESGPVELGTGDQVMNVQSIIPDANTLGGVTMSIYGSVKQPVTTANPETLYGPYPLSAPTPVRLVARQVRLRVDGVRPNWRVGTTKIDVVPGGGR